MTRGIRNLSSTIDEVLIEARSASKQRTKEAAARKAARALPTTEVARGLLKLSADLRADDDDITYADFTRFA